jgi:hypothetical protein
MSSRNESLEADAHAGRWWLRFSRTGGANAAVVAARMRWRKGFPNEARTVPAQRRRSVRAVPTRLFVAVGLSAACAGRLVSASASALGPRQVGASVVIVGGTPAQRQLARLTALRVGGVTLSRVVFRSPTHGLRDMHVHGVELVVASRGKDTVRSEWEQSLYVGAYLGLMARWPKAAVAAVATAHTEGPVAQKSTFLRPYEVFGSNPKTAAVSILRRRLVAAAGRARAQVVELRVAASPARAIALTVKVSDPAAFLKHRAISLLDILNVPNIPLLGYYLGAEDAGGHFFFATSQLPGTGSVFTLPRLDACSPVSHSEMVGIRPPPCPAP